MIVDNAPLGKTFGSVLADVAKSYSVGDSVVAQFVGYVVLLELLSILLNRSSHIQG